MPLWLGYSSWWPGWLMVTLGSLWSKRARCQALVRRQPPGEKQVMILFTYWCCQTWTNLTSAGFLDSSHCFLLLAGNSVKNNRVERSALWMCAGDAQGKRFYLRVDFCFKLAINFSIWLLGKKVFFIKFLFMCASCHHIDYQVETWFSRTSFLPYLSNHSSTNS